jgi:hypothetical protein
MSKSFLFYFFGILFCVSGIYLFLKNSFEEGKTIRWPILIMVMGVALIGIAAAISVGFLAEY